MPPHAYLSSSPRSLWFSLVAMAFVLCSCCRASLSVCKTFSSSSSSALCFSMSLCLLVGTHPLGACPGPSFPTGNTHPRRLQSPPRKNRVPQVASLRRAEGDGQGVRLDSSVMGERGWEKTYGPALGGGSPQPWSQESSSSHPTRLHGPFDSLSKQPSSLSHLGMP